MGLAVAERFLAEGRIVVGVDRDAEALAKAAASNGPAYHPVIVDITDRTALSAALGPQLPSGAGAVVNAAGIYPATTLADYHEAVYRRIFDVNVLGTLNVIAETVPALRASGGGAIVNFASIDAFAVSRGQLLYSASKVAIVSLTRSLAIEQARRQHHRQRGRPRLGRYPRHPRRRPHRAGGQDHSAEKGRTARGDRRLGLETVPRHLHDRRNARHQRWPHRPLSQASFHPGTDGNARTGPR
jgi:NAD(P)-dependent dehydrogenase (short-subunit alcohol dehydrogenase family)